jgi:hypothetical protein
MLLSIPLFVVVYTERFVQLYLQFPPRELFTEKFPFSLPIFTLVAACGFACLYLSLLPLKKLKIRKQAKGKFPLYGYLAIVYVLAMWAISWNRFSWFESLQLHSFSFLWLGFIVIANAFLKRRNASSLFEKETLSYILVFPLSAGFWWLFEYLNRFVQNWYYQAVSQLESQQYVWFASIGFATLLPSVWVMKEIVESYFELPSENEAVFSLNSGQCFDLAVIGIASSFGALLLLPLYPQALYPFVWVLPITLFGSYSIALGHLGSGLLVDKLFLARCSFWALASLFCGLLWEMWNYHSFAKWIYHISYVDVFKVFEMPLLGYFGYLPFGLCCWIPVSFLRYAMREASE